MENLGCCLAFFDKSCSSWFTKPAYQWPNDVATESSHEPCCAYAKCGKCFCKTFYQDFSGKITTNDAECQDILQSIHQH